MTSFTDNSRKQKNKQAIKKRKHKQLNPPRVIKLDETTHQYRLV
jgi:hypothetical protein